MRQCATAGDVGTAVRWTCFISIMTHHGAVLSSTVCVVKECPPRRLLRDVLSDQCSAINTNSTVCLPA